MWYVIGALIIFGVAAYLVRDWATGYLAKLEWEDEDRRKQEQIRAEWEADQEAKRADAAEAQKILDGLKDDPRWNRPPSAYKVLHAAHRSDDPRAYLNAHEAANGPRFQEWRATQTDRAFIRTTLFDDPAVP